MNNFRKKAIALAAVICVALTSFASCAEPNSKSDTKESTETTKSADADNNNGSETETDANSEDSKNNENKDENGDNKTEDGKKDDKSDSDSQTPTLAHIDNENGVSVITPFQSGSPADLAKAGITLPGGDVDLDSDDPTSKNEDGSGYVSKTDSRYCLWIDISKDQNYVFNGDFIDVYFKLKKDIPEKDYAVRFTTDFSSIEGASITPDKIVQGNIRVGGSIDAQDVSSEKGFVAYGENVSAKAGDEVCYRISLKNNPGLAAILVWVYYDSNAMEVEDVVPGGEFADIASASATSGAKPQS